jgi:hypothetical protein
MTYWWNDTRLRKIEALGKKLVPVSFCTTKIPHRLSWD